MKTIAATLAILLGLSIGLNFIQWSSAKQKDLNHQADRNSIIVASEAKEAQYKAAAKRTHDERVLEKAKDSIALAGLKMRNQAGTVKTITLREPVQPLIDSIQALGAFVSAQDELLAVKDSIIIQQDSSCYRQALHFSAEIGQLHQAIDASDSTKVILETDLANSERKLAKESGRWGI